MNAPSGMIDKKQFEQLRKEIESDDARREELFRRSRDVVKLSKKVI